MNIPVLTAEEILARLQASPIADRDDYYLMYSTLWEGFTRDSRMWQVPVDDHLVHRSDGVFEALKCVSGRAYCLKDHLNRLDASLAALNLPPPPQYSRILTILREGLQTAGRPEALIRIIISRGPGSFTVSPYDTRGPQMYVTFSRLNTPAPEKYQRGVKLISSPIPAKGRELATIKSCAYLQNMLVKKSALDADADFAVCFTEDGFMSEGATENAGLITKEGYLAAPPWERMLKGTILRRAMAKAGELVNAGLLAGVINRDITREMLREAAEIFVCSTTIDLLPVVEFDGRPVGGGRPGPVVLRLLEMIRAEAASDNPFTTRLLD